MSCDIGFRVQFNAEFPRQVMNFPIVLHCIAIIQHKPLRLRFHTTRRNATQFVFSIALRCIVLRSLRKPRRQRQWERR